jgi:uncharacterized membrane protein
MPNELPLSPGAAARAPSVTALLHRRAVYLFGALLALTVPAFWESYFFPPKVEADYHVHFHGVSMFLWVVLLVAQGTLIRTGRRDLHRALGKMSYAVAPAMIVSTLLLVNYRLKQAINPEVLYFFYLQAVLLAIFTFAYVQAIRYRHVPALHARYMACTALAVLDPIVARVLFFQLGTVPPMMQVATFAIIDALLLFLILRERERESGPATRVFPTMLGLFVAAEIPQFFVPAMGWWRVFAEWYGSLPLV